MSEHLQELLRQAQYNLRLEETAHQALKAENALLKETAEQYAIENETTTAFRVIKERDRLRKIVEALRSVLSEDGVKEYLSAYVMGVELIDRVSKLDEGTG